MECSAVCPVPMPGECRCIYASIVYGAECSLYLGTLTYSALLRYARSVVRPTICHLLKLSMYRVPSTVGRWRYSGYAGGRNVPSWLPKANNTPPLYINHSREYIAGLVTVERSKRKRVKKVKKKQLKLKELWFSQSRGGGRCYMPFPGIS